MFKQILVATDFETVSKHAFDVAMEPARQHKARLHVVHVVQDPLAQPWIASAYGINLADLVDEERRGASIKLARLCGKIKPAIRQLRTDVLIGAPATEIVRYARTHSIELTVLGTHGRGPVNRVFVGSVANRVLHEAPCPVLIVRQPAHAARRRVRVT